MFRNLQPQPQAQHEAMCLLPNGRNVNISPPDGAKALLTAVPDFFSLNLKQLEDAKTPEQHLFGIMQSIGCTLTSLSPKEIDAALSASTMDRMLNLSYQTLTRVAQDKRWKKRGVIKKLDEEWLHILVGALKSNKFVDMLVEKKILEALTSLSHNFMMEAKKSKTVHYPPGLFLQSFCDVARNLSLNMKFRKDDAVKKKKKENDKVVSGGILLARSGYLVEIFKYSTHPNYEVAGAAVEVLGWSSCDFKVLRKYFKPGKPCFLALANAINKAKTLPILHPVHKVLASYTSFLSNLDTFKQRDQPKHRNMCRLCSKTAEEAAIPKLRLCAGCKMARYCSKECQKKDWKGGHKKICKMRANSSDSNRIMMEGYVQKNLLMILKDLRDRCKTDSCSMVDLVLFIDTEQNKHEVITYTEARDDTGSSRPWYTKFLWRGTHVYDNNLATIVNSLKGYKEVQQHGQQLIVAFHPDESSGVYRLRLENSTNHSPLFTV